MVPVFVLQGIFGDSFYFAVAAMAAIGFVFLPRNRGALVLALLLTLVLVPVAKDYYGQARPCDGQPWCPDDWGFPSGHATVMFVFVGASLGTLGFYPFSALALVVSYSRIADGVHTFLQVAGGAATGLVFFFVCREALDEFWAQNKKHRWVGGGRAGETLWRTKTRKAKKR